LLLSEAVTTLDSRDPVPDAVWENATKHFGEKQLAALVLWISLVNLFNRANIATRQPAGTPLPK
jgi:alkylhydroperoxidase family enzyme